MSVNVDSTGEVWLRWKQESWEHALDLLEELQVSSRFPGGWSPFAVRVNKRPLGKGAKVTVIIGYRRTSGQVPLLSFAEAGQIYEDMQRDIEAAREMDNATTEPRDPELEWQGGA